jgi:hypothetical protein
LRQATRLVYCIVRLSHEFGPTNHAVLAFALPCLGSLVLRTSIDANLKQTGFVVVSVTDQYVSDDTSMY